MQLGFAVAGAALGSFLAPVGFTFLGMSGASLGWTAGQLIGGWLGGNNVDVPPSFGPRLSDLKVQTSTYGNVIPRAFGTVRIAGNIIWAPPITEVATTTTVESGGKGGGGQSSSQEQTTYAYFADFAVAICEGPIVGIRKVWANGELINDLGDDSPILSRLGSLATILQAALATYNASNDTILMTVYTGTETQDPDPTIAAMHGNLTPAFRGTAYVVFQDLPLARFGNRIPNLEFEVVVNGASSVLVPELYYTLPDGISRAGLTTDDINLRRNSVGAEHYWAVLPNGSPNLPRTIGVFSNYDFSLVLQKEEEDDVLLLSNKGLNGRIWYQVADTAVKAMTASGQVWTFNNFDPGGVDNAGVQLYEFEAEDTDQDVSPEIFYNLQSGPSTYLIYHGNAATMMLTAIDTGGRASNQFLDSADRIDGRIYFFAADVGGILDTQLGYCEPGDVNATFNVIRTYNTKGSVNPNGMVGRDGYLYVRSADTGFFNVIEKMTPDGVVVDSVTLTDTTSTDTVPVRMVQDLFGLLYVQFNTQIYRINAGTMEIAAASFFDNQNEWILPDDAVEGRGILVARSEVGHLDEVYILSDFISADAPLLSEVVTDLCGLVSLAPSDLDVSDLTTDTVSGYVVSQRSSVRAMLEPLMGTYFFDAVESDNKIKFVKRGSSVVVTIPEDDLAAHTGAANEMPEPLMVARKQEMDLPVEVNIKCLNRAIDYQVSQQPSRRLITMSKKSVTLEVPIVLTDDQAKQIADKHIFSAWVERESHEFSTSREYLEYEPNDVIGVVKNGITHNVRITQKDEGGDGVIKWKSIADFASIYSQASTGIAAQAEAQTVSMAGPTSIEMLDIPLLRDIDDDAGFYFAAHGTLDAWRGVNLHQSTDSGITYTALGSLLPESTIGHAVTALGDYDADLNEIIDEGNAVTVFVDRGVSLASVTREELLNGANPAVLGEELIQFRDATLVDTDTYDLTGLLRGRRGSEDFTSTHVEGERFVLLNDNLRTVLQPLSLKDQALFYKPVSVGRSLSQTNPIAFTNTARRKKPLAPVHLGGGQNSSGDWVLQWQRRTRFDALWLETGDVPLGENTEAYIVRIMNGDTVVRSINASTNTVTYSAAQQTADWGFLKTSINFEVAQVSSEVGEGYPAEYTISYVDQYAGNVIVLMHMDGLDGSTTFIEETGRSVVASGSAQVDQSVKMFGTGSCSCDGVDNLLAIPYSADFDFGTGDFTIEGWVRSDTLAGGLHAVLSRRASSALRAPFCFFQNGVNLRIYSSSDGTAWNIASDQVVGTMVIGTWHHFAFTRSGTNFYAFLDGVQGSTFSSALTVWANGEGIYLGDNAALTETFEGWIDEVRITRGVARYTAAFTPPSSPFSL